MKMHKYILYPCFCLIILLCEFPTRSHATVFYALDESLQLAFPAATHIEPMRFFLKPETRHRIEEQSRSQLDSDLVTIYAGYTGPTLLGYAVIDKHLIRTSNQVLLTVLDPKGIVQRCQTLAFYEPGEYLPAARWFLQFHGRSARDSLRLGRDVDSVSGATLSARSTTSAVRRAVAYWSVLLQS